MPGADPEFTATQSQTQVWGRSGFGYRGHSGDPRDGAKVGKLAMSVGNDLFAGIGRSWNYDAGVRLSEAIPGRGELQGTPDAEDPGFRYQYGKGDELQRIVDEAAGKATGIETGAYSRIVSRNGSPFAYDNAGRRTEDDRFVYTWNWRGELVEVMVKASWPEGQESPFGCSAFLARRIRSALGGRRSHYGPDGTQLLERRAYVWEGQSLLAEVAYQDEAETAMLWRKTYVPGPSGLDDAIQVKVDNIAAPGIAGSRLYTYLRDELGTVIGVVGEEEGNNPAKPNIPARYLYTPYGEAHIEKSLEIRAVRFKESEFELNQDVQQISDPDQQSRGALIVTFAAALEDASLANGVVVERYSGSEWVALPGQDLLVGYEDDATELKVLVKQGWLRGSNYRVRLTTVKDKQGRGLDKAQAFTLRIAARGSSSDFSKTFAVAYESAIAALDTLGGRFPGGQNSLFQGLWTDPVTGISYARARWYDGRNAGWLSEDPLADVDSPNLYAFVGWGPQSGVDPLGLRLGDWWDYESYADAEFFTKEGHKRGVHAAQRIVDIPINWLFSNPYLHGSIQCVFGVGEMVAGADLALQSCGAGSPVAIPIMVHGADVASTGLMTIATGEIQRTQTHELVASVAMDQGLAPEYADALGATVDGLASAGGMATAARWSGSLSEMRYIPKGYSVVSMDAAYAGEASRGVDYLDFSARQDYLIRVENGKVLAARNGKAWDTTLASTRTEGFAIYVMDKEGNIYLSNYHEPGVFHHSSFLAGAPVAAAGEIRVVNGVVVEVNLLSGHYRPGVEHLMQFMAEMQAKGVDTSQIRVQSGLR